jgi:enoyl-CoA hydratase
MRCFEVEVDAKVAQVRMCRPDELNSMVPEFWSELPALIRRLSDDGGVRAVVLSSTGKHFSAGMDLGVFTAGGPGEVADRGRANANRQLMVARLQESFTALERARMPVLAAIQGGCVGGAVDLVTACDMRYATEDAFFVVQETNIGMTADVGTLQRLPKIIPDGVARELVYTGRRMPAARALQVGLVNEVFPDHAALVSGVTAIATEIAAQSPLAIWGSKQMLVYTRDHSVADGLSHIAAWQTGAFDSTDMAEAFAAKAERRTPVYPDLSPAPGALGS